jgi:hypothetical protein
MMPPDFSNQPTIFRKVYREINSIFEDLDGCGDQHWIVTFGGSSL